LIIGGAGTGKTFLVARKIETLSKNLTTDTKVLVVVEGHQVGLYWELKRKYSCYKDNVEVCCVDHDDSKQLQSLRDFIQARIEAGKVKYVFVDQLEDFVAKKTHVVKELEGFCEVIKCELLWFLWNGQSRLGSSRSSQFNREYVLHTQYGVSSHVPVMGNCAKKGELNILSLGNTSCAFLFLLWIVF
jgi:hypothetical protein